MLDFISFEFSVSICMTSTFEEQADRGFATLRLCTDEDGTTNNSVRYSTLYGMIHQKRGGALRGLRIKREREEYVLCILILRKPH